MTENFDVQALKTASAEGGDGSSAAGGSSPAPGAAAPGAAAPDAGASPASATASPGAAEPAKTPEQIAEEAKKKEGTAAGAAPGAAAPVKTPEQIAEEARKAAGADHVPLTPEQIKQLATTDLLKGLGVTSLDELKELIKPKETLTDTEQQARLQAYESNLDNFAVTKKLMTRDEILELGNIAKAPATDLAFADFSKKFKETKADATPEEIQQSYKLFYNTESTDEHLKKLGEKAIEDKAKEIRSVLETKRTSAKAAFDDVQMRKSKVPGFKQAIQTAMKENLPEKIELLKVDGAESIVFNIKDEDRTALEQFLVTDENFNEYLSGDAQQMAKSLKDNIEGFLYLRNKDKIYNTIFEAGKAIGTKAGSNTGATASFKETKDNEAGSAIAVKTDDLSPEDVGKLAGLFNRT